MINSKRRDKIISILKSAGRPVSGNELSEIFKVSRQIIVQDVAILRAEGEDIMATAKGYLCPDKLSGFIRKTIAVRHDSLMMEEELYIIVENCGRILDIIVEHPVYGEIKANLMLSTREDVEFFIQEFNRTKAEPLSKITNGVHLHTIEVPNMMTYDLIKASLKARDLLLDN
ncbi:MAG: transcription repressor NadR [Eubacteriaceae bacterium]|nr:transcription repressor NadR [Eubacteriaceae bacterium]